MTPKTKTISLYVLAAVSLFVFTTGVAYLVAGLTKGKVNLPKLTLNASPTPTNKKPNVDPSLPLTEACPLNGQLLTEVEKEAWGKRRPLGVMIENSVDARPQSGLSSADIVYEAVAEGGITRFMGIFYCNAAMAGNLTLAPVRSARIYFVNLIQEYDGLYNHVGGAGNCDDVNVDPRAKALCSIRTNKVKDLDQFGLDFKTCHRLSNRLDHEVAYEHTMGCFLEELYKTAEKRGWTNVDKNNKNVAWDKAFISWKFQDKDEKIVGDAATTISYYFWGANRGVGTGFNQAFDVTWNYEVATNSYIRSNGGKQSSDLNTGEPLKFGTVVVQLAKEIATGDVEKHMLYEIIGKGPAKIFMDGVATDGTWNKISAKTRTIFKDSKGKELKLNPGPIWISIVPSTNSIVFN